MTQQFAGTVELIRASRSVQLNPRLAHRLASYQSVLCPNRAWALSLQPLLAGKPVWSLLDWSNQLCAQIDRRWQTLEAPAAAALWYALAVGDADLSTTYQQSCGWRNLVSDLRAWQICQQHNFDLQHPNWHNSASHKLFAYRAQRYSSALTVNSWLAGYSSIGQLTQADSVACARLVQKQRVVLAGFAWLDPGIQRLLRRLRSCGLKVDYCSLPLLRAAEQQARQVRANYDDEQQLEQSAMAYWRRHAGASKSACQLLSALPSLNQYAQRRRLPAAALLKLLRSASAAQPTSDFRGLFANSQLAAPDELGQVSLIERQILSAPFLRLSLGQLLDQDYFDTTPGLAAKLHNLLALVAQPRQSLDWWLDHWPAELLPQKPTDKQQWQDALAALQQLQRLKQRFGYAEFIDLLYISLCQAQEPGVGALAEHLGKLDGRVWLLRSEQLERSLYPNQAQIALPTKAGSAAIARRLLRQLQHSCSEVVYSSDQASDQSSILATIDAVYLPPRAAGADKVKCTEATAPALSTDEAAPKALNKIIQSQRNCPFQSFSEHRLGLSSRTSSAALQPDASLRGQALHQLLEQLAQQHPQGWQQLDQTSLQTRVSSILQRQQRNFPHCDDRWLQRESERMLQLLQQLIQLEAERAPYRIANFEHQCQFELFGYQFSLRLDRVDELASGKKLLIDYKTGANIPNSKDMHPDKFTDPQLAIYSLAHQQDGVSLLQINPRAMGYCGLGSSETKPIAKARNYTEFSEGYWQQLLWDWRQRIEELFRAYLAGDARVQPLSAQSCRNCCLQAFCRVGST